MKRILVIGIAFTLVAAAMAVAQPQVPVPAMPRVPGAEGEPGVANPAAPEVPETSGALPPAGGRHCACPTTYCDNGTVASCEAFCRGNEDPVCGCNGSCDSNGNPSGLNRCACQ